MVQRIPLVAIAPQFAQLPGAGVWFRRDRNLHPESQGLYENRVGSVLQS